MPRARSNIQDDWQTAAPQENGSGCLSLYSLSILAVFLITGLITLLGFNTPIKTSAAAQIIQTRISPIFTREVQHWADDIVRWANAASLNPNLVAVVMQIESCGDPRARSSSNAQGLFQVMPFHFYFGENPYNPETNALHGLNYLARAFKASNGDIRLTLAGYNGGIGVISRPEWMWPSETKRYIYYGVPIYADAVNGNSSSLMLEQWYGKYGAGLCRQASERLGIIP